MSRRAPWRRFERAIPEDGSALVEFVGLAVVLIVPVFYLVLVAGRVEGAAFAVSSAARAAGRAYVTAGSDAVGRLRAELAAELALADDGISAGPATTTIDCGTCTYAPGSPVTVTIRVDVPLPGLSAAFCGGGHCVAAVPVTARHVEQIGCFVPGGGPSAC
ncbi:MAG TPA: hypothetical protein VNG13_03975 [Mycobacteriales bacterium]|nr:hypothetical protein [Mycobacteriales bacterium]